MTKHAPGPWRYEADMDGDHAIWGSNNTLLAVTDGWERSQYQTPRTREEDEANARLIAAAPDLFDYIVKRANEGDADAQTILTSI